MISCSHGENYCVNCVQFVRTLMKHSTTFSEMLTKMFVLHHRRQ